MTWASRAASAVGTGREWGKQAVVSAQTKIRKTIDKVTENPDLPEGIREQTERSTGTVWRTPSSRGGLEPQLNACAHCSPRASRRWCG